jgi:hypothetical protein
MKKKYPDRLTKDMILKKVYIFHYDLGSDCDEYLGKNIPATDLYDLEDLDPKDSDVQIRRTSKGRLKEIIEDITSEPGYSKKALERLKSGIVYEVMSRSECDGVTILGQKHKRNDWLCGLETDLYVVIE